MGPVRQATTPAQRTSLEHLPLDGRRTAARAAVPSAFADGGSGRRVVAGERLYCSTKRVTDVALVLAFAPLWIALYALVVLSILLVDGRPVHYRDRRVGLGGRPLRLLKFRSMRTGADAELAALLDRDPAAFEEFARYKKLRQDPRVTRLGRMIRRFSIDELPQLVHVLIGDLSLVGPRPLTQPEIASAYGERGPELLSVRPGLTGLWQAFGRSDLTLEERAKLDLRYVTDRSLLLDMRILIATIPKVIKGSGI